MLAFVPEYDPRLVTIKEIARQQWIKQDPEATIGSIWIGDREECDSYGEFITEVWQVSVFPTTHEKQLFDHVRQIMNGYSLTDPKRYEAKQIVKAFKKEFGEGRYHSITLGKKDTEYIVLRKIHRDILFPKGVAHG